MMKKTDSNFAENIRDFLRRVFNLLRFRLAPALVNLCYLIVTLIVILTNMSGGAEGVGDIRDFETGKVADRDVIAENPVSYIDEDATRIRMEAQEHLVPAVFRYAADITAGIRNAWTGFSEFADSLVTEEGSSPGALRLAVQAEYPGFFSRDDILNAYFAAEERSRFRDLGLETLGTVLEKGVFALGHPELRAFNPDIAELLVTANGRTERERVFYNNVVTLGKAARELEEIITAGDAPVSYQSIGAELLRPFIKENVFFSVEDSERRVAEARERIAPVTKHIEKGKRIIRKGFVITGEEMRELLALNAALPKKDFRSVIGLALLVITVYALFILLRGGIVMGRELANSERFLLSTLMCLYLTGTALIRNFAPAIDGFTVSLVFPTALMVMIPAVFMGPRLALVLALAFPLGAWLTGSFDIYSCIFALVSGVAASTVLKDAEKRMDLFRAGLIIAAANCAGVIVILLMRRSGLAEYPLMLVWAALNGIVSGMLVLGVLPPLEHALNAVTTFRLIELSDLNVPILRKLFTAAPGTYSHSIMVANLAEQACQDIGANALLARVGAYYHDIGKMDNPGYFVENQTDHNKHDDIAPRLSATVIRSHVKLGVEKARSLGLPKDVISIIAEHHGNSLIAWFYNKAAQQEEQVSTEDFAYSGSPPRSRESAVVMLADVTEAAVRTLTKPTVAKMEKFIQSLFDAKVQHGQLAESELTFRDLETIKNAFVKVLAGYYHSRIEYPNQKEEETEKTAEPAASAAKEDEAGKGPEAKAPPKNGGSGKSPEPQEGSAE
ncbi:MAG: HDIG domain-containing protein [Treponema sp.]|jgi:putative nucleotidyltransferase with HDIG domain|nr:HDIG domain-containing protein [Treponema sp.]